MSLATLLKWPCTVTNRVADGEDEYGDETYADEDSDTVCYAEQQQADENTVNADTQRQEWHLVLPADTTITGSSRVTIPAFGVVLEMVGPPWPVGNPRSGDVGQIECHARQVAGSDAEGS